MRYELLVQSKHGDSSYDAAAFEAALRERSARDEPDGSLRWPLKHGDIEVRPLLENGAAVASELKVELTESTELIRELVTESISLAQSLGLRVIDPNLSKELAVSDESAVADSYLRMARYAGEYLGVSSAVLASFDATDPLAMKAGTKVLIGIVVFVVAVALVWDLLT